MPGLHVVRKSRCTAHQACLEVIPPRNIRCPFFRYPRSSFSAQPRRLSRDCQAETAPPPTRNRGRVCHADAFEAKIIRHRQRNARAKFHKRVCRNVLDSWGFTEGIARGEGKRAGGTAAGPPHSQPEYPRSGGAWGQVNDSSGRANGQR